MGRNKLLPKPDTTVASPINFFGTSTGKGDKRLPALTPELNRGTSVRCGSSFVTPKYPVTCPVCHQSAGELRSEAGHGGQETGCHRARGPGRSENTSPVSNRTRVSQVYSRFMAVAHSHGLSGTRTFLHTTLYTSLPVEGHTQHFSTI